MLQAATAQSKHKDELAVLVTTLAQRTRVLLAAVMPAEQQSMTAPPRLGAAMQGVSQSVNAVLELCCRAQPGEAECDNVLRLLRSQVSAYIGGGGGGSGFFQ